MSTNTELGKSREGGFICGSSKNFEQMEELLLSAVECHGAGGVRQTEMHTAEPFVPQPSASEVEVATGKMKM
jgi:hypothetical protein